MRSINDFARAICALSMIIAFSGSLYADMKCAFDIVHNNTKYRAGFLLPKDSGSYPIPVEVTFPHEWEFRETILNLDIKFTKSKKASRVTTYHGKLWTKFERIPLLIRCWPDDIVFTSVSQMDAILPVHDKFRPPVVTDKDHCAQ